MTLAPHAKHLRRAAVAGLIVGAVVVAGCGGDDERAASAKPVTCADVAFTPNSDDMAAEIRATAISCDDARSFIRDSDGAPANGFGGFACTSRRSEDDQVLPHTQWRCTRGDAVIAWKRF